MRIAAAVGCFALFGGAVPMGQLELKIDHMRDLRGNILLCLTAQPQHFPDCRDDPAARRLTIPAREAATIAIPAVAPGDYAVALIHDENGNGRLDTRLGIPIEGFGFSRNPPIGFGPPKFGAAQFVLQGTTDQNIRMRYIF